MAVPELTARDLLPALPQPETHSRFIVACSGGLDSTVLLHALASLDASRVQAVHVHHGLQASADHWAEHCARVAAQLGVPFTLLKAELPARDDAGPEAAARAARYALLASVLSAGDCLVTAHHREDQAETVLLRLLRGSGVQGLAAMREWSSVAGWPLWRPLLEQPRERLRRYAEQQGLGWIEDPHNADPRYARSWLRVEALPLLRQRWPQADASLARTAALAAEAVELLDQLAADDAATAMHGRALRVSVTAALSPARRHNLIRHWLRGQGFEVPSADLCQRVDAELLQAAVDAEPILRWPGCELRRYRDLVHAMRPLPALARAPAEALRWVGSRALQLDGDAGLLSADAPPPCALTVRSPRPGERFRVQPDAPARTLKNLFQEQGVPPWLRMRLPVLEIEGQAHCIAGVAASAEWRALQARTGWRAVWIHPYAGLESPLSL